MPGTLLPDRLLRRELGSLAPSSKPAGLYGDRAWVHNLDIVNELDGHSGCVNALSWSKSGRLLASGSDDVHLNIHTYQPDHTDMPFLLSTSIHTGHTQNIFSVKFMPHSNDRTLLSAAGDGEIRIFDIEYSGRGGQPAADAGISARANTLGGNIRFLSEADTNAKVFRSHSDRVKRLVTESSPFLFLSCSEDGDVRQWDVRQPSSAYPRPHNNRFLRRTSSHDTAVPPPLISYRRQQLDLNTISCSASQPHYIALGGAHLHCFLHDRRMLGRDKLSERGQPSRPSPDGMSEREEDMLSEATQCVRRFAPQGQSKIKAGASGHITACKISDANPNEMVVSWSGDWIYNFDLVRSPDARADKDRRSNEKVREDPSTRSSRDLKRKRQPAHSAASAEGQSRADSKPRRDSQQPGGQSSNSSMALRVRYQNGQSEDISVAEAEPASSATATAPTATRGASYAVAKALVSVRKLMFTIGEPAGVTNDDPVGYAANFSRLLKLSVKTLHRMDALRRAWRYPMDVPDLEMELQKTLRRNRDEARHFVQAAAVIARLLGGDTEALTDEQLQATNRIQLSRLEKSPADRHEVFCYDFIKAICLWLSSGVNGLYEGFASTNHRAEGTRFPLPMDGSAEDIDDHLIPYLLRLASDRQVPNVDASRFEVDENRVLISSEKAAVISFSRAIKMPFADLSGEQGATMSSGEEGPRLQDRATARKYWGLRVARGLLMNVGRGIDFARVDKAFGGLGQPPRSLRREERDLEQQQEDIDNTEETPIAAIGAGDEPDEDMVDIDDVHDVLMALQDDGDSDDEGEEEADHDDNDSENDYDEDEGDDAASSTPSSDSSHDSDSENDDPDALTSNYLFRAALHHGRQKRTVHPHAPCIPSQLHYRGAANSRTVKDVNFYGLNDEFVVSGSDSGHLFIWDRATGQLVNILEGDGEVVNVVQGHPYEPLLAVSGIDHSVKIFAADARLRANARAGIGTTALDYTNWSSIRDGRPFRRPARPGAAPRAARNAPALDREDSDPLADADTSDSDTDAPPAPGGLASRRRMRDEYSITTQNDADRRGTAGANTGWITRSMLARLAAASMRVRRQRAGDGGGDGAGDDGGEDGGQADDDAGEADEGDEADGDLPIFNVNGRIVVGQDCAMQ